MGKDWYQLVRQASKRIEGLVRHTPLEYARALSRETGAEVFLKLELFQTTGSFKLRGAANKLLSLPPSIRDQGVITASTGNHGAAVLHIAAQLGVPVRVYLPETADSGKKDKLRDMGAEIVQLGNDSLVSEQKARQAASAQGIPFISPYNDVDVIAGQGTATLEILEELPELDALFVPVGGGGLISGAGAALSQHHKVVELVGCQPAHSPVMHRSIQAGKILDLPSEPTLSDGTAGGLEPDSITFPLCQQWVHRFFDVSESAILAAMRSFLTGHQLVAEGAAGLTLASLRLAQEQYRGKRVVLLLCGRNVSPNVLHQVICEDLGAFREMQ